MGVVGLRLWTRVVITLETSGCPTPYVEIGTLRSPMSQYPGVGRGVKCVTLFVVVIPIPPVTLWQTLTRGPSGRESSHQTILRTSVLFHHPSTPRSPSNPGDLTSDLVPEGFLFHPYRSSPYRVLSCLSIYGGL